MRPASAIFGITVARLTYLATGLAMRSTLGESYFESENHEAVSMPGSDRLSTARVIAKHFEEFKVSHSIRSLRSYRRRALRLVSRTLCEALACAHVCPIRDCTGAKQLWWSVAAPAAIAQAAPWARSFA